MALSTVHFPVHSSLLSPQALVTQVLSLYELQAPVSCFLLTRGINDTYLVLAGRNKYILRVYTAGDHTISEVGAELDILATIYQHGVNTAIALPRRDGQCITVLHVPEGERYTVLFSFLEGQPIHQHQLTSEQHRQAGTQLAQLHILLDAHLPTVDRSKHDLTTLIDHPLATILNFTLFTHDRNQRQFLKDVVEKIKVRLFGLNDFSYGICHGDYLTGNLLWNDRQLAVLDFDFSAYNWRVYDLATYIWMQALGQPDLERLRQDVIRPFMAGYQSTRTIGKAEQEAVLIFVLVRQFWLLGASGIPRSGRFGSAWLMGGFFADFVAFVRRWAIYLELGSE
jgi:Ser/Thr protein kinase RdoA (MazF antagonist)